MGQCKMLAAFLEVMDEESLERMGRCFETAVESVKLGCGVDGSYRWMVLVVNCSCRTRDEDGGDDNGGDDEGEGGECE